MYILKRVLTILAAITLIFSFTACQKEEKAESNTINGREWLLKQDSVNEQYIKVMESTEDVYSLYISGKMSSEDFYTELQILQGQLFTIQDAYQKEKDNIHLLILKYIKTNLTIKQYLKSLIILQ